MNQTAKPAFAIDIQMDEQIAALLSAETTAVLEAAARATLHQQAFDPPAALTLLLSDDTQLQQLNRDYLGYDEPTDVLSFSSGDDMPGLGIYLGDIAISVEKAGRQAATAGHSPLKEMQLLTIHGVLHLLGHDHATAEEKEVMWRAQNAIWAEQADQIPEND